ncbi:MAG: dTMP kinase [Desulfobulbus sp.]|jgi:dTMP kinase
MNERGYLIAFEGIDGTGKSTQLPLLAEFLRSRGRAVVATREPTDGPYGQKIRALYRDRSRATPEQELDLFIRDRQQHVDQCIRPALEAGHIVLTDRYYFSTAAYQGAAGCDPADIFARNAFAPEPDLVLLLVQTPQQSLERIQIGRREPPNEFEKLDQLTRVAQLFASFSHPCIVRIDADRPVDEVQEAIRSEVMRMLAGQGGPCQS